jgi:hypothetical protein
MAGRRIVPGMNAESELLGAYREWRRLVRAECKAIQTRNWSLLSDCHKAIQNYQSLVVKLTRETRDEWRRASCNLAEKERNLRVLVTDLIDLTRQNKEHLQNTLATTRKQLDQLGEVGNNLKQIRRSYGYFPVCSRSR